MNDKEIRTYKNGYEALMMAIVESALNDYRKGLTIPRLEAQFKKNHPLPSNKMLVNHRHYMQKVANQKATAESFLYSTWCFELAGIDEDAMRRITSLIAAEEERENAKWLKKTE